MGNAPMIDSKTAAARYRVRYDGRIAEVEWRETPDATGLREALAQVAAGASDRTGTAVLMIDRCAAFEPTPVEMQAIIRVLAGGLSGFNRHVAVVAEGGRHLGMWRRCAIGCDMQGIRLKPFRDRAEAWKWLSAQLASA